MLLRHQFGDAWRDTTSRLEFVPADELAQLASDDIYGYGDFCWADFARGVTLDDLSDASVAALTFFAHAARPLDGNACVAELGNRFLYWGHDDGWHLRLFYDRWDAAASVMAQLLGKVLPQKHASHVLEKVAWGDVAFWCDRRGAVECERSEDIDSLQQKFLAPGKPYPRI